MVIYNRALDHEVNTGMGYILHGLRQSKLSTSLRPVESRISDVKLSGKFLPLAVLAFATLWLFSPLLKPLLLKFEVTEKHVVVGYPSDLLTLLIIALHGPKYYQVDTLHDYYSQSLSKALLFPVAYLLDALIFARSKTVYLNTSLNSTLVNAFGTYKSRVIAVESVAPIRVRSRIYEVYVSGNFAFHENYLGLVQLCRQFDRHPVRVRVGGTIDEKNLSRIAKSENISWVGYQQNQDKIFAEVDAVLIAAENANGVKTKLIESLSNGCIVLATKAIWSHIGISSAAMPGSIAELAELILNPERLERYLSAAGGVQLGTWSDFDFE